MNAEPSTHRTKQTFRSLRWSTMVVSLPFFIMALLLPVRGKEIGASVIEIGLFFTVFSIMTVILRPVVGWGLDRLGRRWFFILGLLGYTLTMLGFAFIGQVWGMILARLVQGIASSFFWLSANAMIADISPVEKRGQSFGHLAQASAIGSIAGTFIGFTILQAEISINGEQISLDPWMTLFLFYALANIVAIWIAFRGVVETNPSTRQVKSTPLVWSRPWILLMLVTLITGASWAMVSPVLIIFLQDRFNAGIDVLSWAFLPMGLIWALLPPYLGRLADRFGRKPLMIVGLIMAAISSFVIPLLGSIVAFAIIWAFQALCYAAGDPAEQALVADLTGGDQRGRAYGFYAMAADLGAAVGPLGGAWLYQMIAPEMPFYINGIILAACAVGLALFLEEPRRAPLEAV